MLSNPAAPKDCAGSRLLACLAVASAAAGFLWVYSAAAYREPVIFPGKAQMSAPSEQRESMSGSTVSLQTRSPSTVEAASLTKLPKSELKKNKGPSKPNKAGVATKSRGT